MHQLTEISTSIGSLLFLFFSILLLGVVRCGNERCLETLPRILCNSNCPPQIGINHKSNDSFLNIGAESKGGRNSEDLNFIGH